MAFKRREGLAGGGITRYADQKIHNCPFCGTDSPNWLTDAYIAHYSLLSSQCRNGYKFQCSRCEGVFEIQGNTDFCFQTESFTSVKLLSAGRGTKNHHKIGVPITIHELKMLSIQSVNDEKIEQTQPEIMTTTDHKVTAHVETTPKTHVENTCNYAYKTPSKAGKIFSFISLISGICLCFLTFILLISSDGNSDLGYLAYLSGFYGVAPLVFGIIGAKKSTNDKGKALAGIILGGITLFLALIALVSFIGF